MDAWMWQLGLGLIFVLVVALALRGRTPRQDLSGVPPSFKSPRRDAGLTQATAPPSPETPGTPGVPPLDPAQSAAIVRALAGGHKIEAIKLLREATGLGLKESKDAVERMKQP